MTAPYFFLRPLLTRQRRWAALDWQSAHPAATEAAALVRRFTDAHASPLARALPLIIPIRAELASWEGFFEVFINEPVTFILPATCLVEGAGVERWAEWRRRGRPLGIQVESAKALNDAPRPVFNTVRFDAELARREFTSRDLAQAAEGGLKRIAVRVETPETFEWLAGSGVEWIDGRFLTRPAQKRGKEPDVSRLKLFKLPGLLKQDSDTREIEAIFREEAKLAYNLLRLVNSVAMGLRTRISNFSQAIAILGRRQLQRWLQLLVYADNAAKGSAPSPLMQLAAARGRQMELLAAAIETIPDIPELGDNAFMTGLFSLLDAQLGLPMHEILKELPLQAEVTAALADPPNGGALGALLTAVVQGETGDLAAPARQLANLGIRPATHARSQVAAYYWAARINSEAGE